ncbi:alpha/beta fold hydrolase [Leifsonia sp. H3M29-4]|uniref:alpha/beta hydrolase family protein n=1 Tax=Salinibacterium metalliresistens TaxID=3031321 RepID=UPI0023DB07BD|nr:alpha/beta fold hydrolase [Salinibacterium metalliresistens]MDF1479765.1 alpha/beta fold hydrolase [Salinibacterium metalliresistens]
MAHSGHPDSIAGRIVTTAAIAVGGALAVTAAAAAAVTVIFARTVVTPPAKREEDVRILGHDEATITLSATLDSLTPGRYSLWFRQDTGHARVGEILSYTATTVTRQLLGVQLGDLRGATRGRFSGWFYLSPGELPVEFTEVEVETELGPAPAWYVPAERASNRWMIGVHGRAVRRQEAIRAIPVFREAGHDSLLISYRNDGDAPRSPDHRYALGDSEWRDVDAAMRYAVEHGAKEIVLMGWSMGGATVLQALTRSPLADRVTAVVLDSPVVDWVTALEYQGVANRLPKPLQWGVLRLLSQRWAGRVTGQREPIDLHRLDFVRRADELHTPILLLHSDDDGYVPSTASRALAVARPDIVTFEPFDTARHTKLWNYDADRWNAAIRRFLQGVR